MPKWDHLYLMFLLMYSGLKCHLSICALKKFKNIIISVSSDCLTVKIDPFLLTVTQLNIRANYDLLSSLESFLQLSGCALNKQPSRQIQSPRSCAQRGKKCCGWNMFRRLSRTVRMRCELALGSALFIQHSNTQSLRSQTTEEGQHVTRTRTAERQHLLSHFYSIS